MPDPKYMKMLDQIERDYPSDEFPEVSDALEGLRDAMAGDEMAEEEAPMDEEGLDPAAPEEDFEDEEDDFAFPGDDEEYEDEEDDEEPVFPGPMG